MTARATFWQHLEELRRVVIQSLTIIGIATLICMAFHRHILALLGQTAPDVELLITSPIAGAVCVMKVSFLIAIGITTPFWSYISLLFILPALRMRERRLLAPFIAGSLLFVGAGLTIAVFMSLPFTNNFLLTFNSQLGTNLWILDQYLSYVVVLLLGHILAAEAIWILLLAVHTGAIPPQTLTRKRRIVIIVTFCAAAILSPPDIITQCLLAVPLLLIYELAILYAYLRLELPP